ncbi:MAG: protein translocase subunit SecD [Lachnospiraceae bacterium]|nr:protein translocase subunit SecD [Lachnospiraceae bacterium]
MKERKNFGKGIRGLCLLVLVLAGLGVWIGMSFYWDFSFQPQNIKRGLDLSGGVSITYEAVDKENTTDQQMQDAHAKFQKRAEAFSTESNVYLEGKYRINVDIPGAKDAQQVLEKLGSAGSVYFIYAQDSKDVTNITTDASGNYVLARTLEEIIADGDAPVDGSMVVKAEGQVIQDSNGVASNIVSLEFNSEGTVAFREATTWAANQSGMKNRIAIIYDNTVVSCPGVREPIDSGKAQIDGMETLEVANELATFIRIGALPIEVTPIRSNIVGATLGSRALETSLIAGLIGFILVCVFMIVIYRLPGVAASLSLIIYLGIVLALLIAFDVTLTLPGIAGIILSVGMAVDANVIIFTRIREEIATGKTVRSSIKLGYSKATSAIVDGNITTLIAAVVLYFLGSGVIKGFAITLGIGIVVSMFSGLLITRWIMYMFYNLGADKAGLYGSRVKKKLSLRVVDHWKVYLGLSGAMIILCIVMLFVNKASIDNILNYGLDFVGGSSVQVNFDDKVPAKSDVEALVKSAISETCSVSEVKGENAIIIKTKAFLDDDSKLKSLKDAFRDKYGVSEGSIETETISGSVSDEMKKDAITAVIIATICMLIYIWIRFSNLAFAGSAVTALVHDVLVVLGIYALFRITVDTSFIACMLTLVGYSINATIVIFDRIRENLKNMIASKESLKDVVNRSISETFTRSINTTVTTLLTVVALIILGVDSIRIFAIPLACGLICGTYSSICITGCLWYFFKTKFGKKNRVMKVS